MATRKTAIERTCGALILLLLVLLVAGFAMGAGGVGIDTRSEYFFDDGPHSWRVVATQHRDELTDGLVSIAVASAVAMATALLLHQTLRSYSSSLVAAGTISLLAAGALMLVVAATSLRIADLAGQWWAAPVGVDADHIADAAFTALNIRFFAAQSTFHQVRSNPIEGDRRYSFQTPLFSVRPASVVHYLSALYN